MTDMHSVIIKWSGELIPVINPDTGEVKYIVHQEGECLLKALIKHMMEEEQCK